MLRHKNIADVFDVFKLLYLKTNNVIFAYHKRAIIVEELSLNYTSYSLTDLFFCTFIKQTSVDLQDC